jgi:hypothetical protein
MRDTKITAKLGLTKYIDAFVGDNGERVNYEYVEIEFAPNCFAKFKLNTANKRALQKYAPNMYQLLSNIPAGVQVAFEEMPLDENPGTTIGELYAAQTQDNML